MASTAVASKVASPEHSQEGQGRHSAETPVEPSEAASLDAESSLELDDIQGLILFGYVHLRYSRYVFLQVKEGEQAMAKAWLKSLIGEVTTAGSRQQGGEKPQQALQIAFTATGLQALGIPEEVMGTFLQEFREGMAAQHRSRVLGDTGGSAPESWQFGGPKTQEIHIVLALFAKTQPELAALHESHRKHYAGIQEAFVQEASLREGNREAFGFRDGITQPTIEGAPGWKKRATSSELPARPGEFIMGYDNAYEQRPFSPKLPRAMDVGNHLAAAPDGAQKDLGRNGTYMVIRKLKQDVAGFRKFVEEHSRDPNDPAGDKERQELLAAKLMGRWPSGAPLMLSPGKDDEVLGRDKARNNAFTYAADPQGLRCPINSHVRRSNPRDTLEADPVESLKLASRHYLMRRGRPYHDHDPEEEGMMFVALNTNIGRQFEFIQQTWLNNPKFGRQYDSRDSIVGDNYDPKVPGSDPSTYTAIIPALPVRQRITGLPRFVHVRGGGYFFLPGIRALRFLCS